MMRSLITIIALLCLPLWAGAQSFKQGQTVTLAAQKQMLLGDRSTDSLRLETWPAGTYLCRATECIVSGTDGLIAEGQQYSMPAGGAVWYGQGAKYTTYSVIAGNETFTCNNAQARSDPVPGVGKFCRSASLLKYSLDACSPSDLGGTGTKMAAGLTTGPLRFWAGWWCGTGEAARIQVVACEGSGCFIGPAGAVLSGASKLWPTVATNATEAIDSPRLQKIWVPHLPEIQALKPQ